MFSYTYVCSFPYCSICFSFIYTFSDTEQQAIKGALSATELADLNRELVGVCQVHCTGRTGILHSSW